MTESRVFLYGLCVEAPVSLPGTPVPEGYAPDVRVRYGARPAAAASWPESEVDVLHRSASLREGVPILLADRPGAGWLRLRYAEGIRFHVSASGAEVWADWRAPMTAADATTFLLGPILGVVLRRHGVLTLHASAVVLGGRAWAFLGPRGSGKSTLAAVFAGEGEAVLTEDVLALRPDASDGWIAHPAYREIRLWDEGARLVSRPGEVFPALTDTWPKRRIDLQARGWPFAAAPVAVAGCFVLEDYGADGVPPRLTPVTPRDALVEFVANAYVNYLAAPSELARELAPLAALSQRLRVLVLRPGHGAEGLAATAALVRGVTL